MKKGNLILVIVVVVVIGGLVGLLAAQGSKPGQYDKLAQCLDERGAKFYGAWWCPHCQAQKAMFGRSAKLLPYVECQTQDRKQTQECTDIGIQSYPTWIFADGSRKTGEMQPSELAELTDCPLQ